MAGKAEVPKDACRITACSNHRKLSPGRASAAREAVPWTGLEWVEARLRVTGVSFSVTVCEGGVLNVDMHAPRQSAVSLRAICKVRWARRSVALN